VNKSEHTNSTGGQGVVIKAAFRSSCTQPHLLLQQYNIYTSAITISIRYTTIQYNTTPHTMKISTTLLALATLFYTALGSTGLCRNGATVCYETSQKPWVKMFMCHNDRWSLKEDCSTSGKICIKPAGGQAYCGAPY